MQEQISKAEYVFGARKKAMDAALAAMTAVSAKPDNPDIDRKSDKPSIYTISSADMDFSLGIHPFTYDFIKQYEAIVELLEKAPTGKTAAQRLDNIANGNGNDPEFGRFHPDAIAQIKDEINAFLATVK